MKGKIITKISVKTVWGSKPDAPAKDQKGTKWLVQIIGQTNDFKTGETDKGPWTKLEGAFQGTNLESGEIFRAGVCFLPTVVLDLVMGQLKMAQHKAVTFGFRIGVIRDESSATNYVYVADAVSRVMEHDPLAPLLAKMAETPKLEDKAAGAKK